MEALTETAPVEVPSLPDDVLAIVAPKHKSGLETSGANLRKTGATLKTQIVVAAKRLRQYVDATTTLAPPAKEKEKRAAFLAGMWNVAIDWMGDQYLKPEPYAQTTLSGWVSGSRVLDSLSKESSEYVDGIDAARAVASIPEDQRDSFICKRGKAGLPMSAGALRPAVAKYLVDNGYRTAPTFSGRIESGVDKWKGSDETAATREILAGVPGWNTPEGQDGIAAIVALVCKVAKVADETSTVTSEVVGQLLAPRDSEGRPDGEKSPDES